MRGIWQVSLIVKIHNSKLDCATTDNANKLRDVFWFLPYTRQKHTVKKYARKLDRLCFPKDFHFFNVVNMWLNSSITADTHLKQKWIDESHELSCCNWQSLNRLKNCSTLEKMASRTSSFKQLSVPCGNTSPAMDKCRRYWHWTERLRPCGHKCYMRSWVGYCFFTIVTLPTANSQNLE